MTIAPNFSSYGSEQQWIPTLDVTQADGTTLHIVFDKFSGGDVTSSPPKYRPAGMGNEVSYLALPTFTDVTMDKAFEQADLASQVILRGLAGKAQATVTLIPLDDNGNSGWGNNRVYQGRLASVKDGNVDSTSSSVRMWSVDISVDGIADS